LAQTAYKKFHRYFVLIGRDEVECQTIIPTEVIKEIGGLIIRTLRPVETPPPAAEAVPGEK